MATIFLCHASEDKPKVREVYHRLKAEGFHPWLDEEDLVGGQLWRQEIPKVLKSSDFILIFLSQTSIRKISFVQDEFKQAIDAWKQIPQGTIHTIPVRLESCDVPEQFREFHWVNLFDEHGFDRLLRAIQAGLGQRQLSTSAIQGNKPEEVVSPSSPPIQSGRTQPGETGDELPTESGRQNPNQHTIEGSGTKTESLLPEALKREIVTDNRPSTDKFYLSFANDNEVLVDETVITTPAEQEQVSSSQKDLDQHRASKTLRDEDKPPTVKKRRTVRIIIGSVLPIVFLIVIGVLFLQTKIYKFRADVTPQDSTVKIMNSAIAYQPGVALKPGKYEIFVYREGYEPQTQQIEIRDRDVIHKVTLNLKGSIENTQKNPSSCPLMDSPWTALALSNLHLYYYSKPVEEQIQAIKHPLSPIMRQQLKENRDQNRYAFPSPPWMAYASEVCHSSLVPKRIILNKNLHALMGLYILEDDGKSAKIYKDIQAIGDVLNTEIDKGGSINVRLVIFLFPTSKESNEFIQGNQLSYIISLAYD